MSKIKMTVERGKDESYLECEGYVMVAWNLREDGTKVPVINTSEPAETAGEDLVHAAGALALAMSKHDVEAVAVVGKLMKATLERGLMTLEAASEPAIKG